MSAKYPLTYIEKYPLTNGDRYLELNDPTIMQNKTNGKITGVVQLEENYANSDKSGIVSFTSLTNDNEYLSAEIGIQGNSAIRINIFVNGSRLLFYLKSTILPINYFFDGNIHTFEIIITAAGLENIIKVDGISYSGSDLGYILGSSTDAIFTNPTIDSIVIGKQKILTSVELFDGNNVKGNILELKIFDTDLTTELYSLSTNGTQITASSPTTWIKNTALELNLNENTIDTSDVPKVVTENGTPPIAFTTDRFGALNKSLVLDGIDQYLGISGSEEVEDISFWINPSENNRDILQLSATAKISINASNEIIVTGLANVIIKINDAIKNNIILNRPNYVSINFDVHTADLVQLGYSTTYFKGSIDSVKLLKYQISATENKSEFKKYPSN